MKRVASAVSPILVFVEWLFSEFAPGVDLFLGLLGAAWLGMMVGRPAVFMTGNLVGMQWAPEAAWITFVSCLVVMHVIGLSHPGWIKLRVAACLASSWYWILIAISLSRPGLTPGTWTYSLIGILALSASIYLSGRVPRSG